MKKDAYYFSHDSNARHDENILAMRSVYKGEGYGWYWIIIEMMRDANSHRLQCTGKYWYLAMAQELQTKPDIALTFINDCVNEFGLFKTDGEFIWSESLLRRMANRQTISELARKNAIKRWGDERDKNRRKANAKRTQPALKQSSASAGDGQNAKDDTVHTPATEPEHQKFAERLLSDEGALEREAIEHQTRTRLTPELLAEFNDHLTTAAKHHTHISAFNSHLRNWLNTRPRPRTDETTPVRKKVV